MKKKIRKEIKYSDEEWNKVVGFLSRVENFLPLT